MNSPARETRCPECGALHLVPDDSDDGPARPCQGCLAAVADQEEPAFACSLFGPGRCSMVPDCLGDECPPAEIYDEDFPASIYDVEDGIRRYRADGCRDWELLGNDFVSLAEHLDDMGLALDQPLAVRWRATGHAAVLAVLDAYGRIAAGQDGDDVAPQELADALVAANVFGHVVGVKAPDWTGVHPHMRWFYGDTLAQAQAAAERAPEMMAG